MADLLLEPWNHPIPIATVVKPAPAPPPPPVPLTIEQAVTSAPDIARATDKIVAARVLQTMANNIREGRMTPQPKNPKMRGLIDNMSKFNHQVDCDIDDASKLIVSAHSRRTEVFTKVRDHVASTVGDLTDMLANFDDLESVIGDNGAPSSDGGSQGSQVASANSTDGKTVP